LEGIGMSKQNGMMKRIVKLGLILMMGVSMSACSSSVTWKEEVQLHDGSKIIVNRSQSYGGRHEIGQGGSISEQEITFTLPNTNKTLTFKSEFSEDIGGINFILLALHILNGTPYMVVEPRGCLAYNKWGMPNPPYVFFKHNGKEWQRIPLAEFPTEFKIVNLVVSPANYDFEKTITEQTVISVELVKELNDGPGIVKTILHAPYPGAAGSCGEMIYDGKGGWHGTGLFGKTYADCLNICYSDKISPQYCPCETLFKGKK
jgi:hypothetical protein